MEFLVHDQESVRRLRDDRSLKLSIRRISVRLDGGTNAPEFETQLNKRYFACGCQSGAVAVYLALAIAGATHWLTPELIAWNWWKLVGAVLLAGLVGKLAGLQASRIRLNWVLGQLEQAMSARA